MSSQHCKRTIISMAVIASAVATLLHEGVGHGLTAWLRGDIVTELTSNHLSTVRADRWVSAAGTLANLLAGMLSFFASRKAGISPNLRYFLWLLAALNLLPAAGYFLFSGIFGFGDWNTVIQGLPHPLAIRFGMALFGFGLYGLFVKLLAVAARPFVPEPSAYNVVGRLPYIAACLFSCAAGALDPLGLKLFLVSTVPAAFGGSSGLLWADALMPHEPPAHPLFVQPSRAWWIAAALLGGCYIFFIGRGIHFNQ